MLLLLLAGVAPIATIFVNAAIVGPAVSASIDSGADSGAVSGPAILARIAGAGSSGAIDSPQAAGTIEGE
jgi:hypothetical protein